MEGSIHILEGKNRAKTTRKVKWGNEKHKLKENQKKEKMEEKKIHCSFRKEKNTKDCLLDDKNSRHGLLKKDKKSEAKRRWRKEKT